MSTGPFKDLDEFKVWFKETILENPEQLKKDLDNLRKTMEEDGDSAPTWGIDTVVESDD